MAMAAQSIDSKLTAADFMALGEGPPYPELIDGKLISSPSPSRNHQRVIQRLYQLIQNFLDNKDLGEVYLAPFDVHLGDHDVFCPDLSYFSGERLDRLSDRGAEGAPDLVVEVLSPATARRDRHEKRPAYARSGVRELWLVHPELETIEVFDLATQPDQPIIVLENGTHAEITSMHLPGFTASLAAIFRQ